jgi:hypothetical protein
MWEVSGLPGGVSAYEEGLLLMGRTIFGIIFKSFWKLLKKVFSKERTNGTLIFTLERLYCIQIPKNNTVSCYIKSYTFRLLRIIIGSKCIKGRWLTFTILQFCEKYLFLTIVFYYNHTAVLKIRLMQP